jgi:hypothetical protein
MVLEQNLSLVNKIDRLLRWGHWYTFFNILLALLITGSYFLADPLPHSAIGWLYLLLNWLGHTAFLCFLFFILTIFPVSLIFPYQRHVRGIAAVLATVGLVALIFDAYVYHSLGYHAGSASYEQTTELLRQQVVTNLRNFILITTTVAALLLVIQLTISNYCWKKIARLSYSGLGKPALAVLLGCFVLSHLLHIWGDARKLDEITRQDNVLPLTYPATARTMLTRYNLMDNGERTELSGANWLSLAEHPEQVQLQCETALSKMPVQIWLLPIEQPLPAAELKTLGLRSLPQHMAPADAQTAWQNFWYARFSSEQPKSQRPQWLQQLPADALSLQASPAWQQRFPELTALVSQPGNSKISFVLVDDVKTAVAGIAQAQPDSIQLLLPLTAAPGKFALGKISLWYRWDALQQLKLDEVTQQLDLLPTLLAHLGCRNQQPWHGDNLLQKRQQTKLNIVANQLYMFRKDKLQIIDQDGEYSVWSAGSGVRLEQKLDIPLLTDALKRLPASKTAVSH